MMRHTRPFFNTGLRGQKRQAAIQLKGVGVDNLSPYLSGEAHGKSAFTRGRRAANHQGWLRQ
jgi:hypothetical protein